jgi:error-prone DNA polymerase
VVRFAEAARELDMATVFGAESLSGVARTEAAGPPGPHLLVLARGPEGYRRLSRQLAAAHLAGGAKGVLRYDYDALADAAGGHWQILTGCRKGHVRQALSSGGPEAAGAALADLVDRFGAHRVSVELTGHGHPLDDERNAVLAGLADRFGVGVVATTAAHFAAPARGRLAMAMSAIRARSPSTRRPGGWPARWCAPALGRGDGPDLRQPSRSRHRGSRIGAGVRVRPATDRPAAATVPGAARAHRGQLAA